MYASSKFNLQLLRDEVALMSPGCFTGGRNWSLHKLVEFSRASEIPRSIEEEGLVRKDVTAEKLYNLRISELANPLPPFLVALVEESYPKS